MGVIAKRSSVVFFSDPNDHYCHQLRIVFSEKDIAVDIHNVTASEQSQKLLDVNPYHSIPTLVDRDLVLYEPQVIMEYLDERYPHPPLLPAYPVHRAKSRLMIHRIYQDIYFWADKILDRKTDKAVARDAAEKLRTQLLIMSPIFSEYPYFMREEFSLLDCCLLPILWRLPLMEVELPPQANNLKEYAKRLFQRPSFKKSLSTEEDMCVEQIL